MASYGSWLSDAFQAKPCNVALWKKAVIVEIS
jgi:hypothetical protein